MEPAMWRRPVGRVGIGKLLAVGLALAPAGCDSSGVGSVDFDKAPDARAIGAPPRSDPPKTARPPRGAPARRKTGPFAPG